MGYTTQQIEQWKKKAEKWDELEKQVLRCYPPDEGDEEEGDETDYIKDADLCDIGEFAAKAFGFL